MIIDKPGIYDIPASVYHADPCPEPSLSSSIARKLLGYSAMHARHEHPRLNPAFIESHDEKFDRGTAAHAYLLQGETGFVLIDAADFKTAKAREQRAAAWVDGKTPLLVHRWDEVLAMVEAANRQLDEHEDPPRPFSSGTPERTLVWTEDGVWCRARLDWLHGDRRVIDDYKSGKGAAEPVAWERQLYRMGHDVQAAFYLRGLQALTGAELDYRSFRFVPQENTAPFGLSVVGLGPQAMDLAARKVERAIALWRHSVETKTWPGYPKHTCWIDLPPWEEARFMEREAAGFVPTASHAVDDGRSLAAQLFGDEEDEDC